MIKDFTRQELIASSPERAEVGVACQQSKGGTRDFIRKRKRAYHRAWKRGDKSFSVTSFISGIAIRLMSDNFTKQFYENVAIYGSHKMTGLAAWLPRDDE